MQAAIQTYRVISRLHRVPVPHTNDAVYGLTADGRRWVAKREADMGFRRCLPRRSRGSWVARSAPPFQTPPSVTILPSERGSVRVSKT